MYRFYATIMILLVTLPVLKAQRPGESAGVISSEEWNMRTYPDDDEAGAVVIYDQGDVAFTDTKEGGMLVEFKRRKRVKIFDKSEFGQAEIYIPYHKWNDKKQEKINDLQAFTYNLDDGKIVKTAVDPQVIVDQNLNGSLWVKKMVFPQVSDGSIIEYSFRMTSPYFISLPDWEFQSTIPTLYSQYSVSMVPFYEYVYITQGIDSFDIQKEEKSEVTRRSGIIFSGSGQNMGPAAIYNDVKYTYGLVNIPAFRNEKYITSANDYIAKIDFQLSVTYKVSRPVSDQYSSLGQAEILMTSWPQMIKDLSSNESFGGYLDDSEKYAKRLLKSEIPLDGMTEGQKATAIINYMKLNFRSDGVTGILTSRDPKELIAQKSGSVAEINLFLTALLKAAGVSAFPVISSTRDHGKIDYQYPFFHYFNQVSVLVVADRRNFLADASDRLTAYNRIPPRSINEQGLVVNEDNVGWVRLDSKILSGNNKLITIEPDPENQLLLAGVTVQASEYEAYNLREAYEDDQEAIRNDLLTNFSKIEDIRTINYDKHRSAYVIAYRGEKELDQIGDKFLIRPFLHYPLAETGLREEERKYPVDFVFASADNFKTQINIPEGYAFRTLPEDLMVKDDLAAISITYQLNENQLIVVGSYSFFKAVYEQEDYATLKKHMELIVDAFNKELVLELVQP